MNIVEAYIKYKSQLIILISGLSGSGITNLGKNISRDFKIKFVNYKDYIKHDIQNTVIKYNDKNIEFVNMDTDEVIDWDKFLSEIKNNKQNGVVATSPCFFSNSTKKYFNEDAHINVKLNKINLVKRRIEYDINKQKKEISIDTSSSTESNNTDNTDSTDNTSNETNAQLINMIVNTYTFPFYLRSTDMENVKITKFINANEYIDLPKHDYDNKIYDVAYDYIINVINRWLDNHFKESPVNENSSKERINKYKKEEDNLSTSEPESLTDELVSDETTYLLK